VNTKNIEHVVLVDENDHEIGTVDKASVHTKNTPLHRGFSLFGFDDEGRLLLQKRALTKKPGQEFGATLSVDTPRVEKPTKQPPSDDWRLSWVLSWIKKTSSWL
jgi:isopentenyl-diphosphate delta-isomerase